MEILRKAAYRRMPWKNGGGETFEIAISPPGASFDTFDWRVSMAVVERDGPFSIFPGIDRTLCVLEGAGVALDFGASEGDARVLTPASDPFHFAADRALEARLLAGTITDLNVMTRSARCRHSVQRLTIDAPPMQVTVVAPSIVFCERGELVCTVDGGTELSLGARDCLVRRDAAPALLELKAPFPASVYLIQFYATAMEA